MNCPGCGAKVDIVHTSLHHFQWILLKFLRASKLPASLSVSNSVKAVYRETYGNSIWSTARNKRAYFPLSVEEYSKPLRQVVETTVRRVKPFPELKDQEESKKQEENEYAWGEPQSKMMHSVGLLADTPALSSRTVPVLDSAGAVFAPMGMSLPHLQNADKSLWIKFCKCELSLISNRKPHSPCLQAGNTPEKSARDFPAKTLEDTA